LPVIGCKRKTGVIGNHSFHPSMPDNLLINSLHCVVIDSLLIVCWMPSFDYFYAYSHVTLSFTKDFIFVMLLCG
jgi:hypothetical protein